jgi:uncharacterized repeat protein (TIGR02543 family)
MKKVSLLLKLFVSILLIVFFTVPVIAATLEVGEGKAYTSIQTAINDAVTGDTVLVYDGTYVENISVMGKSIAVRSVNGATSTIIDGNASGSVMILINGEGPGSALDGFTITNGNYSVGGGIYCYSSSLTITNSTITGNTANDGGGILCDNCALTITNSTITGNTANNSGGGIYYVYSSSSTITNCTISGNTAGSGGGGISFVYSSPTITNSGISGNTAGSNGGGIYCVSYSSPTIADCTITGNTVTSTDMQSYGGGIYCANYSFPTITNCTISGNAAGSGGGGIYCVYYASPAITNCTITENTLISTNMESYGGGIYCVAYSSPTITNCTITKNSAISYAGSPVGSYGGGIYSQNDSSPTIKNSILWGDSATTGNEIYLANSSINVTYSDVDQEGYAGSNGNIRQDPLFVDPENGDFHLQSDSPCIDAGTSDGAPPTDMESFPRYDDLFVPNTGGGMYPYYDMGAYEYLVPTKTLIVEKTGSGTVTGTGISCDTDCTETYDHGTVVVLSAAPEPGFVFDGWSGACSGTGGCEVMMIADVTVTATFTSEISPNEGTIGTRITITGSGFGDKKGKVLISGIPATIAKGDWSEDQVMCTIKKLPFPVDAAYPVYVVVNKVSIPVDGTFTLKNPALDDLVNSSGAYPDQITITGKFFGTKKGKVDLYDPVTEKKKNLKVTGWKMIESTGVSELTFVVPKPSKGFPAGSYQLMVANKIGTATASTNFTLEPLPLR